jgi:hypothetical protein
MQRNVLKIKTTLFVLGGPDSESALSTPHINVEVGKGNVGRCVVCGETNVEVGIYPCIFKGVFSPENFSLCFSTIN